MNTKTPKGLRLRGMRVDAFSELYGPGRSKTYEEISSGRLRARKCGKLTIITEEDAEEWLRNLPSLAPGREGPVS
jgi:hypothetical protein